MSAGQLLAATMLASTTLPMLDGLQPPRPRLDALVAVVVLGVLGTGLAYVLNYRIIADDGPVSASFVIYLLPVVAVVLGVVGLHERLTTHAIGGSFMIVLGVAATRRKAAAGSLTP
ncbi:EamA family transporter [Krasilnikovia cinnamomea]